MRLFKPQPPSTLAKLPRPLKPRSEDDCPICRQAKPKPVKPTIEGPTIKPWRELKSQRGRPKQIRTEGFACANSSCQYFGVKAEQLHALVGDGKTGKTERSQTFKCQACNKTFSARRHTPLYRLKTPASKVSQVLMALADGVDLAACERIFGHRKATLATWLNRAGQHSQSLHAHFLVGLALPHLQLDEIRTRLRSRVQVLWVWLCLEPTTKLIPTLALGARPQVLAHQVIHQITLVLTTGLVPIFTSDGLNHYFYALSAHFGRWVVAATGRKKREWQIDEKLVYGQLVKSYRRRKLSKIKYLIRAGLASSLREGLIKIGFSGRLNTAFIERLNLTVRHGVAALSRRSWSTASPKVSFYYIWNGGGLTIISLDPHQSLRLALGQPLLRSSKRLAQRYRRRTPAMAVGMAERIWSVQDLLSYPLPPLPVPRAV